MELSFTSIALGIGLSAASGFRVFVPLLLMSGASLLGYLDLAAGFEWIGTVEAMLGFGMATVVEILAYSIPWLDNALDTIATPTAVGAGVLVSASVLGDLPPFLQWTLSVIAGGGAAGLVQGGSVAARAASSTGTGGLGNILVSTGEAVASVITTLLALLAPLLTLLLLVMLGLVIGRRLVRRRRRSTPRP